MKRIKYVRLLLFVELINFLSNDKINNLIISRTEVIDKIIIRYEYV